MIARLLLIFALLLPPTPPAYLSARWDSSTSATVQWQQTARGCLYRESAIGQQVFVGCYEKFPATIIVEFGHEGPLSGDLRPTAGDVYILWTDNHAYRAPLLGRPLYFPAFRA